MAFIFLFLVVIAHGKQLLKSPEDSFVFFFIKESFTSKGSSDVYNIK